MSRYPSQWTLVALLFAACSPESPPHETSTNQPPTVWVVGEHLDRTANSYSMHFEWGGLDPDGTISHYEYLIVDGIADPSDVVGTWTPVTATEATHGFANDSGSDGAAHTFLVRAVDQEKLPSSEPGYIAFTPTSLIPNVRILIPPIGLGLTPAAVPPVSTFEWIADLPRPEPDSVQFAMVPTSQHNNSYAETIQYLRSPVSAPDWFPWVWYDAPAGKGRSWTTPPLDLGAYVFAIRAKLVGGPTNMRLVEPINVRRVRVMAPGVSGPQFVVEHPLMGRIVSFACDFPLSTIDILSGTPLSFALSATAEHYGGTVVGYRYGWDLTDPSDPEQWEIDFTPFYRPIATTVPRTFFFGSHTLTAEAMDNLGQCSRIEIRINLVPVTGERSLLVVDDDESDESPSAGWVASNGALPNDAEHDAFWLDMVSAVDGFDPSADMIETSPGLDYIPLATIASYKAIVWSVYSNVEASNPSDLPLLYSYIKYRSAHSSHGHADPCYPGTGTTYGTVITNFIAQAMQAGIHVMIAGHHPVQNVRSRDIPSTVRWPLLPLYELEPGSSQTGVGPTYACEPGAYQFAYQDLCVDVIDYGYLPPTRARTPGSGATRRYCAINGWRVPDANSLRDDTMRGAVALDPAFAAVTLRPEAAGPGRFYQASARGYDVEVYNPDYFRHGAACEFVQPPRSCFEPIFGLDCLDTFERTYLQPVAFWAGAYADVVSPSIPGAVAARSAVFGFPPVFFHPSEIKPAIEHILFDEWQLPRSPIATSSHR